MPVAIVGGIIFVFALGFELLLVLRALINDRRSLINQLEVYQRAFERGKPPPNGTTEAWYAGAEMKCFVVTEDKVILRVEDKLCTPGEIYSTARWLDGIYCEMKGIEPSELFKEMKS